MKLSELAPYNVFSDVQGNYFIRLSLVNSPLIPVLRVGNFFDHPINDLGYVI